MPIEIRELSIKTQIVGAPLAPQPVLSSKDLHQLKKQLLQECLQILRAEPQKNSFER